VTRVLIVKTGSTFPGLRARRGDFEDWILDGMGIPRESARVVSVYQDEPLPGPDQPTGVVVTGSPAMVSDREDWSERTAAWLADAVEAKTPVLGICYGHQLLAHGLGGRVGINPNGRQIGTRAAELNEDSRGDPLLGEFGAGLQVQVSHVEAVLELPPGARLLGSAPGDPHHAFAVGPNAWGVQCHPEFDLDVMRTYLAERRAQVEAEGLDPDRLLRETRESDHGTRLLRRFAGLLRG
jgi:GMP synthase (glutamine-hydrolysing)